MKCRDIIRELSEYLDGNLDESLIAEVERHMQHCDDCRLVVDTTRKTIRIYCNQEPAPLPDDVSTRLRKVLEARLGRGNA